MAMRSRRGVRGSTRVLVAVLLALAISVFGVPRAEAATGWYIVVDQTTQHAKVYTDAGEYIRLIPISSGRGGATPNGNFAIYSKSRWATSASNGNVTMPYMSRIVGGVGFHGIPLNRGVPIPTPLGIEPVSAGCIRMADADAEWIYSNMPIGTPVIVQGRWNGPTPPPDPPGPPPPEGGVPVAVGDVDGDGIEELVTGSGLLRDPVVQVWRRPNGVFDRVASFSAYSGFRGGVNVAAGDVDGDGRDEVITGVGAGGGPHVKIFDVVGTRVVEKTGFMAYASGFVGGVSVGAGDVDGDGRAELITGTGGGGSPHVRVFDVIGAGVVEQTGFMAYASGFVGGVSVGAGDVDGDGSDELITGAGAGGSPHVRVLDVVGAAAVEQSGFLAYAPSFRGGVRVGAYDQNDDGRDDVTTSPVSGGGPHVRVFDGANGAVERAGFLAYAPEFSEGVFVAGGDIDGGGGGEIVTGPGPRSGSHVRVLYVNGGSITSLVEFMADQVPMFTGGANVASGDYDGDGKAEIAVAPRYGSSLVRVFDADIGRLAQGFAFEAYPGAPVGVDLTSGDVDGDGQVELITSTRSGSPHVRVFDVVGAGVVEQAGFMAYTGFTGGVSVAAADVDGVAGDEVITGTGAGGGPHVRVFDVVGAGAVEQAGFMAYAAGFTGGVSVAAGDIDGADHAEIVTAPGPGGGPHVRVFDVTGASAAEQTGFMAYSASFVGGVNLWAGNIDGDPHAEVVTAPQSKGGPHVRVFDLAAGLVEQAGFYAYETSMSQGVRPVYADVDGDAAADLVTTTGGGGPTRLDLWIGADTAPRTGLYAF